MPASRFLAVCLNPVIQNTLVFDRILRGEVNRTGEHRVDASGKGVNVARVLGQLGCEALYLAQLGGPTREWFLAMCEADGVRTRWAESNSEIRVCTTVIDRAEGHATELVEEARTVGEGTTERLLAEYALVLPGCDAVIVSGTKAAGFAEDTIPSIVRLAAQAGKRIYLDIKGADLVASLPFRPVLVKPNLEELLQTRSPVGDAKLVRDEASLRAFVAAVGREYSESFGASLIVTRGARSTWYWEDGELRDCPASKIEAINPTGSGDSFMAGAAAAMEEGGTLKEAVAEGMRLGSLNAQRLKPGSIL